MLFSSITFLYFFLPITMAVYFLCPKSWRNGVLLLASLVFYFFGEPIYVLLLLLSSLWDYLCSLGIEKHRGTGKAKAFLIASMVFNLGLLGFFKYIDFFIGTANDLFNLAIPLTKVPLPIGISFFTFQTMSYTIDVYRGQVKAQKNLATLATFVCLFPQLIAGPIVRYVDVARELESRTSTLDNVALGTSRFLMGLGKKVLLANAMGELCLAFHNAQEATILFHWIYAVAFSFQIYFDFSGYSDMAIGLGRIFGFTFLENFNYPFISKSITEFWRRWHMTLGGWFRDYVYIPLGGNRKGKARWMVNIAIVWCLTGLWHGAAWNFVLWGAYFGIILMIEKLVTSAFHKVGDDAHIVPRPIVSLLQHTYVIFLVLISFVIFNATSFTDAISTISGMFTGLPLYNAEALYYLQSYGILLALCAIGSVPFWKKAHKKLENHPIMTALEPIALVAILVAVTAYLVDGSFNPFLYFRF